ncbi:hypothetical protein BZA77DRAFT_57050 [Pyronema omphalodes]|nr:hypothetical protein BZA77DRAFT_57050 [Pyronema omphalodes]
MNRLNCLISNVRSILHLLDSQMTALRQFQNMIKKGYHAHYTPSNGYHEIHLHLPFRLQGFRSLRIVLRELDILITERKEYTKEFQKLIHSLEQRQMTYTMFHATHEAAQKNFRSRESETKKITELMKQETKKITELMKQETKEITELMQQETKGVEEQRDIARKSFNTMSMFTVVTVFFLPPGFFCALWAILPGKDTRKPYSDVGAQGVNLYIDAVDEKPSLIIFCAVSIPITLTLTIITLYIVLLKKYKSGDHNWITKLFQKYVIGTNRYKSSNDPESGTPQNGQDPR